MVAVPYFSSLPSSSASSSFDVLKKIKKKLHGVRGLTVVALLDASMKAAVLRREEAQNKGVRSVLLRKQVVLLTHDASFRQPEEDLTGKTAQGSIIFSALPFPELVAHGYADAIVASPGWAVHEILQKTFQIPKGDASLLVGFG